MNISEGISEDFILLTEDAETYLNNLKKEYDRYDLRHSSLQDRIDNIKEKKDKIFEKLTDHFTKIWNIAKDLNKENFIKYRKYYQEKLLTLFTEAEVNKYIYTKPLGYAGDFRMMNYIIDYHDKYFGESSFQMLINHYTCNISISRSNIERKDYFKKKILEVAVSKDNPRMISIGGGPLRELIELLIENKINKPIHFIILDLEPLAVDYVQGEIEKINNSSKKNVKMEFIKADVKDLLKKGELKENIKDQDFIYVSGVFDYLSDRFCSRLLGVFWELLAQNGKLIICNANLEGNSLRAYFEFLGEWEMKFRTNEEMLKWTEEITGAKEIKIEKISPENEYLFMALKK